MVSRDLPGRKPHFFKHRQRESLPIELLCRKFPLWEFSRVKLVIIFFSILQKLVWCGVFEFLFFMKLFICARILFKIEGKKVNRFRNNKSIKCTLCMYVVCMYFWYVKSWYKVDHYFQGFYQKSKFSNRCSLSLKW